MNKKEHNALDGILAVILALVVPVGGYIGWKLEEKKITKVPERKTWTYFYTYTKADGNHQTVHERKLYTYEECKSELKNSNLINAYGCAENCKIPSDYEGYREMDCSQYCTKIDDRVTCSDSRDIMTVR